MGLVKGQRGYNVKSLDMFKKKEDTSKKERKAADIRELEIYSGMRVIVETPRGQLLFIGDLQEPYKGAARLRQCSDGEIVLDEETAPMTEHMYVRLRGYNDHERKAVYMEGLLTPEHKHVWRIEELTVTRVENERTFYRLNTDMDAVIGAAEDGIVVERQCRLLNISVGGVSIRSAYRYHKGERFLLKVRVLDNESEVVLYCEVLRIAEKSESVFEYGCRFLELAGADQEQIAQIISAIGNKEREKLKVGYYAEQHP